MSCPRCAKPVPPGAAFCPSCGGPLRAGTPPPTAPRPAARPRRRRPRRLPGAIPAGAVASAFEDQRRRTRNTMIGVGVAALLAALFGAGAYLRLGASAGKPALQVRAEGPPPALQLPAHIAPPALQKEAVRAVMPADVEAWLKHLEECEKRKVAIAGDQTAEAMVLMQKMQALGAGMGLMDPYDQSGDSDKDKGPGDYAKGKVMDFRPRWQELLDFFNSVPPPDECKPIAADYNRALSEVPGMMGDIGDILNSVSTDPSSALQQAKKLQGGSYGDIDRYFARTDQKLTEICKKYERSKWFNIKTDVSGSTPLSSFGGLGGGGMGSLGGSGLGQ